MRRIASLTVVCAAALLGPTASWADTRGTWMAAANAPAAILGEGFPVAFYRVCFLKGNPVKVRYVLENDKAREAELKLEGSCVDLKAKRIEIQVQGGEGVAATGTYTHLPQR